MALDTSSCKLENIMCNFFLWRNSGSAEVNVHACALWIFSTWELFFSVRPKVPQAPCYFSERPAVRFEREWCNRKAGGKKYLPRLPKVCSMWTSELEDVFRSFWLTALNRPSICKFLKSLLESFYANDRQKIPHNHFPSSIVHYMKKDWLSFQSCYLII